MCPHGLGNGEVRFPSYRTTVYRGTQTPAADAVLMKLRQRRAAAPCVHAQVKVGDAAAPAALLLAQKAPCQLRPPDASTCADRSAVVDPVTEARPGVEFAHAVSDFSSRQCRGPSRASRSA